MKVYRLILFIAVICIAACKKETEKKKFVTLNAAAFYLSPLNIDTLPLKNQAIKLTDLATGYVYNLTTDTNGVFAFPGLLETDRFRAEVKRSENDSDRYRVVYVIDTTIAAGQNSLVKVSARIDTAHYNAMLLSIRDAGRGAVQSADVWAYTSGDLANLDTGYQGYGSILQLKSNRIGNCLLMQLPAGPLYIRSQYKITAAGIQLRSGVDTLLTTKFSKDTILLH